MPKKLAPSAAVTGVLRLSSILSNCPSPDVRWEDLSELDLSADKDDGETGSFGGENISRLLENVGEVGGEVAVGGEKHKRLNETHGNTRDFFLSGTSGLDPGLGK